MIKRIDIHTFLSNRGICLDIRSPSEYKAGHIPNAISFPLFSDEERAEVGTTYKQIGSEEAFEKGLEFTGPKLAYFVKEAKKIANSDKILYLYCYRGGKRSGAMSWLLDQAGFTIFTLDGGYKTFRKLVLETMDHPPQTYLMSGFTGTGKTQILKALRDLGENTIDWEDLASHRGSAFGNIGLNDQPTQEQFENNTYEVIRTNNHSKPFWTESESRRIGALMIPLPFFKSMYKPVKRFFVSEDKENRIQNILREYQNLSGEKIKDALFRLRKRIGLQRHAEILTKFEEGDLRWVVDKMLDYYDPLYQYTMNLNGGKGIEIQNQASFVETAKLLIQLSHDS
jgi:tRNA 2-selenouridine synthase